MAEGDSFKSRKSSFPIEKKKEPKKKYKKVYPEKRRDLDSIFQKEFPSILTSVKDNKPEDLIKLVGKAIDTYHDENYSKEKSRYQLYQYQSEEKILTSLKRLPGFEKIMPEISLQKEINSETKEKMKKVSSKKLTPMKKNGSILLSRRNEIIENEYFWFGSFVTLGLFVKGIAETWPKKDFKCPPETMFYIIMDIVRNCGFGESFITEKWTDLTTLPKEISKESAPFQEILKKNTTFTETIKTAALSTQFLDEKTRDHLPLLTPSLKIQNNPIIALAFSEKKLSKNEINTLCAEEGLNPDMFQSVKLGGEFLLNKNVEEVVLSVLDIDRIFHHLSSLRDYLSNEEWAKIRVNLLNQYEKNIEIGILTKNDCYQLLKKQFSSSSHQDRLSDESIYFELSRSFIATQEEYRQYFKDYNDGIGLLLRHWGFADVKPYTAPSKKTDELDLILILKRAMSKKMPHLAIKEWYPELLDKNTIENELKQRKKNESLSLRHEAFEHFKPIFEELDLQGAKLSLSVLLPLIDVLNNLLIILKRLGNDREIFQKVELYLTEGTKNLSEKTKDLILFSPKIMQKTKEEKKTVLTYDGVLLALQARSRGQFSAAPSEYRELLEEIESFILMQIGNENPQRS